MMQLNNRSILLTSSLISALLTACGPETNSRYGDEHWDPQSTWDKTQVISQPELRIVYKDIDSSSAEDWEGYVSIDFTDLVMRDEGGENTAQLAYSVGTSERLTIDDFVQGANGSTFTDPKFYYDSTTSTDRRLRLTDPEVYTFYLDLAVRQPNGTLRVYNYEWDDIVVPGPLSRDNFWANRMNALVEDNCVGCHGSSGSEARTDFDLSSSLLSRFVNKARNPTEGKALPGYPFNPEHTGSANVTAISDSLRDDFTTFTNAVIADGTGNDFTLTTIDKPEIMENDPYN